MHFLQLGGAFLYIGVIYLAFDVPRKINQAVETRNISKIYGRENSNLIRKPLDSSNITQSNLNSRTTAVPASAPVQPATVNKPVIRRNRAQGNGTVLVKGQKCSIPCDGALKIGIGWDCDNPECELDVSAFMLAPEKVPDDSWFVFYGQDRSPDKSVTYKSNSDNSYSPDDAEMIIRLGFVNSNISRIKICITIYEAFQRRLDFSMVKNIYLRIMSSDGTELMKYQVADLSADITSLVVGEIYRYNNMWKFCAIGSGFHKDLAEFCNIYGVEIE
ncbi:MAG: TerD family protein [Ruminococcus flavefaciens]|nr:TerD family protein [Ruminococcus flavefaciens]MCM1231066.1 TerD family protein [Ruminococcus flavefaciens]